MAPYATSAEARAHLVDALLADLVGPSDLDPASTEELPLPPSRFYLTGFLAPQEAREQDDVTADDELAAGDDDEDEAQGEPHEPEPKLKRRLPASIGLSVILPPHGPAEVEAAVTYADYKLLSIRPPPETPQRPLSPAARQSWKRVSRPVEIVTVPLDPAALARGIEVPNSRGLKLFGRIGPARAHGLPDGARALAVFLVNQREPGERGKLDEQFAFQVELEIKYSEGLLGRADRRGQASNDWDDRVLSLQFRRQFEYAVGHGVSVEWQEVNGAVRAARTVWIPRSEVRRVVTNESSATQTSMEALAALDSPAAVRAALSPFAADYGSWIAAQRAADVSGELASTRDALMNKAADAQRRISEGVALLEREPLALEAFRLMNRSMAMAARQRSPERYAAGGVPRWRLFQLAFVLLNLNSLWDDAHPDRDIVELVFFPTGGGKTEAYLGVIAFALALRRLRGVERPDGGLGVAVLLRYTLRLLTLDQLGRAATLICALEILRREVPQKLGDVRFSIGLWVGRSATANTIDQVKREIVAFRMDRAQSPFPLTDCPWCSNAFAPNSFELRPTQTHPEWVLVGCLNRECPFSLARDSQGLPVLFVDEQIYRELPSFIVATVDKFALLPWRAETGMLFGHAQSRIHHRFYGPGETAPRESTALPSGLRPPELIVQDELHLISGPLGTMVGLYEGVVEKLCRNGDRPPKIIASTATVRRADKQVRALFARTGTALFPPQGVNEGESYFARVDRDSPGRLYLGVGAMGRATKAVLLRVYTALLSAAAKCGGATADPYMTLVGYFNSLRELGGMRRLCEDEVRSRAARQGQRFGASENARFANREIGEPVELTSREPTTALAKTKRRLAMPFSERGRVDVCLASNMISVGVDIDRLGLMVVGGQPKTTSEYIQATSRVGRDAARPGLVVTVYNLHKPRDRSHYERFAAYHGCFYRFVETGSVTPFSGPALDRALAAVVVALTRLSDPVLTPAQGAMQIEARRAVGEAAAEVLAARTALLARTEPERVRVSTELVQRVRSLLDSWVSIVRRNREEAGGSSCYSPWDRQRSGKPLLYQALDDVSTRDGDERKFVAPTSMRDVEPSVHLWIERQPLTRRRRDDAAS